MQRNEIVINDYFQIKWKWIPIFDYYVNNFFKRCAVACAASKSMCIISLYLTSALSEISSTVGRVSPIFAVIGIVNWQNVASACFHWQGSQLSWANFRPGIAMTYRASRLASVTQYDRRFIHKKYKYLWQINNTLNIRSQIFILTSSEIFFLL